MVSVSVFAGLVAAVVLQRLFEVRLSRQNETALRARGALEHAAGQMPWMILLHACWLAAMLVEVLVFARPFHWPLALTALSFFLLGQGLRFAAMWALGQRWTVKVLTLPNAPPVTHGVFRFLRHPNYLGVVLELAALPLVHTAWLTALVFSLANAVLLTFRIRAEERALDSANDYERHFRDRSRLIPGR